METKSEFILIKKLTVRNLIRRFYKMSYTVMLMEYVLRKNKIEVNLTAHEVCHILNIPLPALMTAMRKNWISHENIDAESRVYNAFEIVELAEKLHRKSDTDIINSIPVV